MSDKKYYSMLVVQVLFVKGDAASSHTLNGLMILDGPNVTRKAMERAQQASQARFYQEVMEPAPDLHIVAVTILNIIPLGQMTAEEFNEGYPANGK